MLINVHISPQVASTCLVAELDELEPFPSYDMISAVQGGLQRTTPDCETFLTATHRHATATLAFGQHRSAM